MCPSRPPGLRRAAQRKRDPLGVGASGHVRVVWVEMGGGFDPVCRVLDCGDVLLRASEG